MQAWIMDEYNHCMIGSTLASVAFTDDPQFIISVNATGAVFTHHLKKVLGIGTVDSVNIFNDQFAE